MKYKIADKLFGTMDEAQEYLESAVGEMFSKALACWDFKAFSQHVTDPVSKVVCFSDADNLVISVLTHKYGQSVTISDQGVADCWNIYSTSLYPYLLRAVIWWLATNRVTKPGEYTISVQGVGKVLLILTEPLDSKWHVSYIGYSKEFDTMEDAVAYESKMELKSHKDDEEQADSEFQPRVRALQVQTSSRVSYMIYVMSGSLDKAKALAGSLFGAEWELGDGLRPVANYIMREKKVNMESFNEFYPKEQRRRGVFRTGHFRLVIDDVSPSRALDDIMEQFFSTMFSV